MCRYAEQDQPRPRRCFYLEDPCDECAEAEQIKMDELYEEYLAAKERDQIRINDHLVVKSH